MQKNGIDKTKIKIVKKANVPAFKANQQKRTEKPLQRPESAKEKGFKLLSDVRSEQSLRFAGIAAFFGLV